ncbi:CPBP family intramembrane glutamic endopeptidase [Pelagibacterium lacus]|uniref:CPBP family intramembrane metalloprotease n=1 Tax=Pelagibacterium lacus TaxID=2282655 RepID=A0A369W6L4_9HYPH|nr:CPBP family intramembrane glutamic endopeptidase [Pelagibacterium lacus]RDE10326.1 CPBP family intramembrane metalloprotease [Pelagibacterium lacus]
MTPTASPYLRAGLVWLAMIAIWLALGAALSTPEGYSLGSHIWRAVLATAIAVPMVVAARRLIDRESVASLGLAFDADAVRQVLIGAAGFLIPAALGFAVVIGMGWATITPTASIMDILGFVPLLIVLVFLYEALPEELAFRGYIQTNLEAGMGHWPAIFAQAALFALWGAVLWSVFSAAFATDRLVMFFFVALVLGIVRGMTGSVWTTIGLHVGFQTVAQLLLNTQRGHFAVEGVETMQLVALGVVPFSLAALVVQWLGGAKRAAVS